MRKLIGLLLCFGLCFASVSAAAQAPAALSQAPVATVEFLDVGQGDAILIRSPEGKVALIDAGPSKNIVKLLQDRGVTSIDLVVVSHHHADHYGGMDDVIRKYKPRVFLASASTHTTQQYLKLLQLVKDNGMQMIVPGTASRELKLGTVVLSLFPQPPEDMKEENNNSVGLHVQFGETSFLLTGDSEDDERNWWLHNADHKLYSNVTVLKLAHHGSKNGTDKSWLQAVKPKLAIASVGKSNKFGHPHAATVNLLEQARVKLLRTDMDGSIAIETDGKDWHVVPHISGSRAPPDGGKDVGRILSPDQAKDHVGEECVVEGTIVEIGKSGETRFLNFVPYKKGGKDFCLVILEKDAAKFGNDLEAKYRGKKIRVTGKVEEHQGRPQIKIADPSQIQVVQFKEGAMFSRPRPSSAQMAQMWAAA